MRPDESVPRKRAPAVPAWSLMTTTTPATSFETLNLAAPLMQALTDAGYTTPTPIQAQAIPPVLEGHDLLGLAETGTGKTAAFSLPLLHRLAAVPTKPAPRTCRALILAPTRELAIQIGESIATYGKHMSLTHTVIFGGVGARPQMRAMERGVDIVVATPGRLLDLIDSRHVRLDQVTQLILDEADRMLDMGFIHDVRKIVKMVPRVRQTLMFSATMPNDIAKLAAESLHDPVRVEIAHAGKTVDRIEQRVHHVANSQKRAALVALLQNPDMQRVIVFARTKRGADRVARGLAAANIPAHAIHGNKSQNARQDALEAFRKGRTRVLVATDIAARGIDIDDITHVINYELPNIPESYVHRIGRTARAGATGIAIALCAPDERPYLRDIERLTRQTLTDGGKIEGIEAFANLPEPKHVPRSDDDAPHFKRANARISQGRRNNRAPDAKPEHGTGRPPHDRGEHRGHAGGDRRPQGGDRNRGEGRGEQRGDRPFQAREGRGGDRPPFRGDRPRSDRPFGDRPRSDRGDRPRQDRSDRPEGAGASDSRNGSRERSPEHRGEHRGERRDGGRPQGDRKPFGAKPFGAKPFGDRADRPRGDFKPREDRRSFGERPRFDGERKTTGDAPRPGRRDGDQSRGPSQQRAERPAQGRDGERRPHHAGGGRPFEQRGDRGDRPHGGDRRPSTGFKPGNGGGFKKPWENRDRDNRGSQQRRPERSEGGQSASAAAPATAKPDVA